MYIKTMEELYSVSNDFKQVFQNQFSIGISKNEVLKMKNDDILTDRDVEIAKLLFRFTFATLSQIYDYLKKIDKLTLKKADTTEEVKETTINSIHARLDKLTKNRILNKFVLVEDKDNEKIESDAENIYCLDLGGKYLLESYSDEDTSEWFYTANLKAPIIISKKIISLTFYLSLLTNNKESLLYFETNPLRKCERNMIIPDFEFSIRNQNIPKYFVCEIVKESDLISYLPKKMDKYERLIETNAWKKYYDSENPPILFLICETDLVSQAVGKLVSRRSIEKYRLSSFERIQNDLSIAFMQYVKEADKLKQVKLRIFDKEA